jgi:hypothetical protein
MNVANERRHDRKVMRRIGVFGRELGDRASHVTEPEEEALISPGLSGRK